jgi:hypothetical protein
MWTLLSISKNAESAFLAWTRGLERLHRAFAAMQNNLVPSDTGLSLRTVILGSLAIRASKTVAAFSFVFAMFLHLPQIKLQIYNRHRTI